MLKNQKGFTLLEILVAVLVLSIGMLGIAGLQASSLQYGLDASSRAQVTVLAEDIMAKVRMRTNVVLDPAVPGVLTSYLATPTGTCDPLESTVVMELTCWYVSVEETLPNASAVITRPARRTISIRINWYEQGARSYGTEPAVVSGSAGDNLREGTKFFTLSADL